MHADDIAVELNCIPPQKLGIVREALVNIIGYPELPLHVKPPFTVIFRPDLNLIITPGSTDKIIPWFTVTLPVNS